MLKPVSVASMALLIYLVAGCDNEKPIQPKPDNTFRFRVEVVDSLTGKGVDGLVVGAWNHLTGTTPPISILARPSLTRPSFVTGFRFSLLTSCRVYMNVLNLRNDLIDSIDFGQMTAGFRVFEWSEPVGREVPSGVYKCRLVATDILVTDSVLCRDSIMVTIWRPDPLDHPLGTTNQSGVYETKDSLLFPNVLNLPEMTMVNQVCDTIGLFGFGDTVSIGLTDTSLGQQMILERVVLNGPDNIFKFVWKPQPIAPGIPAQPAPLDSTIEVADGTNGTLPDWGFSQNCPNPFN